MPATITTTSSAPSGHEAEQQQHRAAPRGMWRASRPTSGLATAATTPAASSGMTIVCASDSSQTSPTIRRMTPTSSHDSSPSSRSQLGAETTPVSSAASISKVSSAG